MRFPLVDIGCGGNKAYGAWGLDLVPHSGADGVADLREGLPFAKDSFARARLRHVVEHVPDLVKPMAQVHRVCRAGAG